MIFENSSPKGSFGPNMSDSPNWSLTASSRSLQAAALKVLKPVHQLHVIDHFRVALNLIMKARLRA